MFRYLLAALLTGSGWSLAIADDVEFFEQRIRPVLIDRCYSCHNSADDAQGDLAVDHRDGLRDGGSGGVLIVPGDPTNSRLIAILKHQVEGLEMPEDSGKLDDAVIADFEKWIADGASDPRDQPPPAEEIAQVTSWEATMERRKQWWSLQPIQHVEPPAGAGHPVDRFIRAKLAAAGLSPAEPAEPAILIRRLYFALIGLPPTPAELRHWLDRYHSAQVQGPASSDPSVAESAAGRTAATITTELVDDLLDSDQFGPRWARHWMDWIRYAESHGSEGDPLMKNAWMYRDYLIRALNDDVPYDQLVREHLAGDLLPNPRINDQLALNESLLGAIQLRMVFHGFSPTDALDEKVRFVDDQVNTISKAFLGLTVSCARCHDHKFDAISQADFYAMFGIFAACRPGRSIADAPQRLSKNRAALASLKQEIRAALAEHWIATTAGLADRIQTRLDGEVPPSSLLSILQGWQQSADQTSIAAAWNEWVKSSQQQRAVDSPVVRSWDLSEPADFAQWNQAGLAADVQPAGHFAVALQGDNAVQGVYPGGVYSHSISTRDPLRITSPDIVLSDKYDYWVRAIGDQDSQTRYVAQDYPRTGTVYPAIKLKPKWTWHRLKLDYWTGDSVHFELATGPDIPLQASDQVRSWFGVSNVRVVPHDTPLPANQLSLTGAITAAIDRPPTSLEAAIEAVVSGFDRSLRAWQAGSCNNQQANLIDHGLRTGLLNNHLNALGHVKPLIERYRELEREIPTPRRVPGLDDVPAREQPLFIRGNHKQPDNIVPRRFLTAIDGTPYPRSASGRRQLAEDILRDENPLSRRVIVNRIWHHLFGQGIVVTPDNFGRLGARPTHPELLDYLAEWFVDNNWSLKSLIRMMVTSETWQQTSRPATAAQAVDPDNALLSHANVRRLEAEAIRDAMLRAAGTIDLQVQGAPVNDKSNRRSAFLRVKRNALNPMLRAFDFPEPHSAVGRRDVTNVPAQSLLMMNSPLVAEYASQLAGQLGDDADAGDFQDRVTNLYERVLTRWPTDTETNAMRDHLLQTKQALRRRQRERDRWQAKLDTVQAKLDAIIEPKRAELSQQRDVAPIAAAVQPLARWEFTDDLQDSIGDMAGELQDGAQIANGQLVVSQGGYASTRPLRKPIREKTLEAWVQLDNLDQRGGGVITLQTKDGRIFDSIVFAERESGRWMAGSDGFSRTQDFAAAPIETDAAKRLVHVAISYHGDGTVVGYREGQRYGTPFKTNAPIEYRAGEAVVSFGVRHFPNQGNRQLAGSIESANLYDRALTDEQVADSFAYWSDQITDQRVMKALTTGERERANRLRMEIENLRQRIDSLGPVPAEASDRQAWTELVRTMFMLKEFIYVR